MSVSSHCPPWCTAQHHHPDYITHARTVAELDAGTVGVLVEISQHVQPGHVGDETVNVVTDTADETELTILVPEVAAAIGHALLTLDDAGRRAFAVALVDAAALVLTSRAATSADPRSTVEREAEPNTAGCEAQPHTGDADGR